MSKVEVTRVVGKHLNNIEEFDTYRQNVIDEFHNESIWHRQKLTQGAYWTRIDKDLASQYLRDERWFFGIKYLDEIKLIDHGINKTFEENNSVGFKKR